MRHEVSSAGAAWLPAIPSAGIAGNSILDRPTLAIRKLRGTSRTAEDAAVINRLDRWADPPLLVLASLADEPKHGYAITRDVAETMGVRLTAGTLYAVIARLEAI